MTTDQAFDKFLNDILLNDYAVGYENGWDYATEYGVKKAMHNPYTRAQTTRAKGWNHGYHDCLIAQSQWMRYWKNQKRY